MQHKPYLPWVYLHDTLRCLISDIIHNVGDRVPGQTRCGVEQVHHFLYGVGGVEPRPYGIISIQDSRHSIMNVSESGVSFHSDDCVCVKGLPLVIRRAIVTNGRSVYKTVVVMKSF